MSVNFYVELNTCHLVAVCVTLSHLKNRFRIKFCLTFSDGFLSAIGYFFFFFFTKLNL